MPDFKPQILIVDESEGVREAFKLILSDEYQLILTENYLQLIDITPGIPHLKLIYLGLTKAQSNVFPNIQNLKDRLPHLNIVVLVSTKSTELATEAIRHGASGYLVKPFKSDEILATTRKLLSPQKP